MLHSVTVALGSPLDLEPPADAAAWWAAHAAADFSSPFEAALLGGLRTDRLAFAFASGYEAALASMLTAPIASPCALCATEDGPPHPKHLETQATQARGEFTLRGTKSFVTLGHLARSLLVFARDSAQEAQGHVQTGVYVVPADAPGVSLERMPTLPFVPEIPHARVILEQVRVPLDARLPGDGWADFVRPFRTVEDIFVHVGLLGYVLRLARLHDAPPGVIESVTHTLGALASLARCDASEASTHVALAGAIHSAGRIAREVASWLPPGPDAERLARDAPLMRVASKARALRLAKARTALGLSNSSTLDASAQPK